LDHRVSRWFPKDLQPGLIMAESRCQARNPGLSGPARRILAKGRTSLQSQPEAVRQSKKGALPHPFRFFSLSDWPTYHSKLRGNEADVNR